MHHHDVGLVGRAISRLRQELEPAENWMKQVVARSELDQRRNLGSRLLADTTAFCLRVNREIDDSDGVLLSVRALVVLRDDDCRGNPTD